MIFDSVSFHYNGNPVLRGVYLKIDKGTITGLYGHNGSGKTTLIRIGAGLLPLDNGTLFINGKAIESGVRANRYKQIGYLPQETFLPADINVKKLSTYIPSLKPLIEDDPVISKVSDIKISSLSGGELRYLEILLLFSLDRQFYLLDEPLTGIEPILIEKITRLLIKEKEKGKGILITDHYFRYVNNIADKAYYLKEGYSIELDTKGNIQDELLRHGYISVKHPL